MHCPSCSAELSPRATFCAGCGRRVEDPLLGRVIGDRYEIEARIAIGGFGAIYRATQVTNGREVAIKIMHRELVADPQLVARFRREAAALCSLRDAHTVTTYEFDQTAEGDLYIVMELLDGKNLLEVFHEHGALPWLRVFAIARSVCSALAEAHALGIVHRDLKPANIFLDTRADGGDLVKVLDFGIAKIMKDSGIGDGSELTAMGQAVGTLEYMAPEQLMGGKCDGRTDIYTLGVVAYEITTGRRPFGAIGFDLLTVQLTERPPPPSAFVDVPPVVDEILLRCLEHDPADRFPDVATLAAALGDAAAIRPTPRPRPETPYEPLFETAPPQPPARPRVQVRPESSNPRNRPDTPYQPEPRLFAPEPQPYPQAQPYPQPQPFAPQPFGQPVPLPQPYPPQPYPQLPAQLPAATVEHLPRMTRPLWLLLVFVVIGVVAGALIAFVV